MQKNKLQKALVTSKDQAGIKEIDSLLYSFLRALVYSYNISDITLRLKNNG